MNFYDPFGLKTTDFKTSKIFFLVLYQLLIKIIGKYLIIIDVQFKKMKININIKSNIKMNSIKK
jgi:hypothetical protein